MTGTFDWTYQGTPFRIGYEVTEGEGPPLLLLPAMSTVSTRDELRSLASALAPSQTVIADWPGFGENPTPEVNYAPRLIRSFLEAFVRELRTRLRVGPFPIVACGHGAGYALELEARHPRAFSHLILVAPTWRGPFPTMMRGRKPIQGRIRQLIETPVIGDVVYRLNVSRPVVRLMYRRHVFSDPTRLTSDLLSRRMRATRRKGARFASASFVTGGLDPFHDRESFLETAAKVEIPILALYGAGTPPKSRAEMDALAGLATIRSELLPAGTLGLAEEAAPDLAARIRRFLESSPSDAPAVAS